MTATGRFGLTLVYLIGAAMFLAGAFAPYVDALPLEMARAEHWFGSALGVAGLMGAYATWRGYPGYGLVVATMFAGGAAALMLTRPLWFPELRLKPDGLAGLVPFALIGLQALAALVVHWRAGILHGIARLLRVIGPLRLLSVLALMAAFNVSVLDHAGKGDLVDFAVHVVAAVGVVGVNSALCSGALPAGGALCRGAALAGAGLGAAGAGGFGVAGCLCL